MICRRTGTDAQQVDASTSGQRSVAGAALIRKRYSTNKQSKTQTDEEEDVEDQKEEVD